MIQVLWIALGGAIGAVLRYLMATGINAWIPVNFPIGTLLVNSLGCLIIGIVYSLLSTTPTYQTTLKPFLVIGILGGFTTFSSYAIETFQLAQTQQIMKALLYIALSNFIGLASAWLGFKVFST
ncbi:MAG: fluoride efflux transporter CrcB [Bacteroidia bacterium]|nr:fluoride efflux transporter CrcB [Bacteroidia bacterium]